MIQKPILDLEAAIHRLKQDAIWRAEILNVHHWNGSKN
jgi:hypothetical protein